MELYDTNCKRKLSIGNCECSDDDDEGGSPKTSKNKKSENKWICDVCQKRCQDGQQLIKHKLSHSLILTCDICRKSFTRRDNLKYHRYKIHGNRRSQTSFKSTCEICNKLFVNKSNLVRHKRNIHKLCAAKKDSSFQCRHCLNVYEDYSSLFLHVELNHPIVQSGGQVPPSSTTNPESSDASESPNFDNDGESEQVGEQNEVRDESALNNVVQTKYIYPKQSERYDMLVFLANVKEKIGNYLQLSVRRMGGIKWNLCTQIEMQKSDKDDDNIATPYFRSATYFSLTNDDFSEHNVNEALQKVNAALEKYMRDGSGWYVKSIIKLEIHTIIYKPISGSTYIPLPNSLAKSGSVLNIENTDEKCFVWSVLASIHPAENIPTNVDKYRPFQNDLHITGIKFPMTLSQIDKFENQNPSISINVFTYEDNEILPLKITTGTRRLHHVNLLLLKWKDKSHYALITDLNRFLSRSKSVKNRSFFCPYCLHGFIRHDLLTNHLPCCSTNGPQKVELPVEGQNDILEFKDIEKGLKVPFVIYADFETLNTKLHSCSPNLEHANTTAITKLEVCGFGYKVVCVDSKYTKPTVVYRGENASIKLIECLLQEQEEIEAILRRVEPMVMSEEDIVQSRNATECCICKKTFTMYDQVYSRLVRHHNHVTGSFIGMAHNKCNLNCKQAKHTCVIFHNLKNFDAHILCESIGRFKKLRLNCIAQTTEKYVSFSLGNLRFIDSLQFLPTSLENLVNNLVQDGVHSFPNFLKEFPYEQATLLLRKGVYPYEYMDNEDRFQETSLPPKEAFYSNITKESISDENYAHAQEVYQTFSLNNLGEYHDLYLKTDVVLLCDVFEAFRNVCMEQYQLDCCHYYTSPGLAWSACLKMTGVTLQLMTDIDQILFVEKAIRGGISQISNRYKCANNPLLDNYDVTKPTSYLLYLDMNNLYGLAMNEKLPIGSFRFLNQREIKQFVIEHVPRDGDVGFMLEVSLEYPEHLHVLHNDYPLAPERKVIEDETLSPYSKLIWKKLHGKSEEDKLPPRGKVEKLVTTLEDKDHYVVHYRNLQLYLNLGMKIKQIHRILEFQQEAWMKPYIDYNTAMRKKATSPFQKNFYKLMNVSVFGKVSV